MAATGEASFAFAFGAGLATFFSPCVYALLPGYVGYYAASVEGDRAPLSGALARGGAASVGAIGTFAVLSVLAFGATTAFERALPIVEPLVGVALIVLGGLVLWTGSLHLSVRLPARRSSVLGFGLFGAMYALAATACVLPLFLSITVISIDLSPVQTVIVLGAYAGAFALLMLAATVAIAVGRDALFDRFAGHTPLMTRIAGVILIGAGLVQLYLAFWVAPVNPL